MKIKPRTRAKYGLSEHHMRSCNKLYLQECPAAEETNLPHKKYL